jgi:hypothetical protein
MRHFSPSVARKFFGVRRFIAVFFCSSGSGCEHRTSRRIFSQQPVEKGCHCWLVQQCMGETPGKTLLDKPAVAPKLSKSYFFNRLVDSSF